MVRPVNFGFNEQTSVNNTFQQRGHESNAQEGAIKEFDEFVQLLRSAGVEIFVIEDTPDPYTPDSVFPNNWFSTHEGGTLVLYPMFAQNRRLERKPSVINFIKDSFRVKRVVDLTKYEDKSLYLEGTGSMIFDRDHNLVFACRSVRTDERVLEAFCDELDYDYFLFNASDSAGNPIYHTNVMMCIASGFAVVCLDAVKDIDERQNLIALIEESDKQIIEISLEQMEKFAGNMLEVESKTAESILVMSKTAYNSLTREQVDRIGQHCKIVAPNLTTIENNGGGSARCMMAELFLTPVKQIGIGL